MVHRGCAPGGDGELLRDSETSGDLGSGQGVTLQQEAKSWHHGFQGQILSNDSKEPEESIIFPWSRVQRLDESLHSGNQTELRAPMWIHGSLLQPLGLISPLPMCTNTNRKRSRRWQKNWKRLILCPKETESSQRKYLNQKRLERCNWQAQNK